LVLEFKSGWVCIARVLRNLALPIGLVWLSGGISAQDSVGDLERFATPRSGIACPSQEQFSRERPDPEGTPTVVGLALMFQDISRLSDVDQTLDADLYIVERWRDPRLADPARGEYAADCPVPANGLWMPAIEPENLRSMDELYTARFLVDAEGVITLAQRLLVTVSYPLDFRDFPFDRHRWTVTLWPVFSRSDEIVFKALDRVVQRNPVLLIQGWKVGTPRAKTDITDRIARSGKYARFDVTLDLERDWSYYVWKLGVPLTLIVLMAYGVYYIPVTAVAQKIGLGMTSMLTLIAYMLALTGGLPRISYLTRADRFFVGSAILVFLGLVIAVFSVSFAPSDDKGTVARVNRFGRWLYPAGMILNVLVAFFL
jgi:hypothetical protein